MNSKTPASWTPSEADNRHLQALHKALSGTPHGASEATLISYALRTAAEAMAPSEAPEGPPQADPNLPVIAYTDGACSGNPGPGGWAVVLSQGGQMLAEFTGGSDGATTNNRMELTAVREALRRAPAGLPIEMVTDSQNVIGWLSKGWKSNDPIIAALCREIDALMVGRKVTWKWVKGHAGDPMNERVDKLAVEAIRQAKGPTVE